MITRALGYQPDVTVDLFRLPLQVGDIIVLSSDGMHGLVTDAEIMQITTTHPPEQASQQLIDLANSRGGTDNITVIVAHIEALDWIGSEPAAPEDLHERVTVELPTTQAIMAQAAESAEPPVAPAAPAPSPPARRPAEPGLNWRGFVLALALLTVLIGIILFYAPSVLARPAHPPCRPRQALPPPPACQPARQRRRPPPWLLHRPARQPRADQAAGVVQYSLANLFVRARSSHAYSSTRAYRGRPDRCRRGRRAAGLGGERADRECARRRRDAH
ncbi:MAG: hypothetical protein U0Z44_11440 [Kouleothrix sp.]